MRTVCRTRRRRGAVVLLSVAVASLHAGALLKLGRERSAGSAPPSRPRAAARGHPRVTALAVAAPGAARTVAPLSSGKHGGKGHRPSRFDPLPINQTMCEPLAAWQTTFHPTCCLVHEIGMIDALARPSPEGGDGALRFLGRGGWRLAFRYDRRVVGAGGGEPAAQGEGSLPRADEERVVVKMLRYDNKDFDTLTFRRHHIDVLVSDRLRSSPYSIDAYGFCGQTLLSEAGAVSLKTEVTRMRDAATQDARAWDATLGARLDHARAYARALAALHGPAAAAGGAAAFAHHDVKPMNALLVGPEGARRLKLNDYNDAEPLRRNATAPGGGGSCAFRRRPWGAEYASPEAALGAPLTHALDVYALGGVLFYLLTGRTPYGDVAGGKAERFAEVYLNRFPRVPEEVARGLHDRARDAAVYERGLLALARGCRQYRPAARPSAQAVADVLERMTAMRERGDPVNGSAVFLEGLFPAGGGEPDYRPRNREEAHALFEQFLEFRFDG